MSDSTSSISAVEKFFVWARALPATDALWNEIPRHCEELQELARHKAQERELNAQSQQRRQEIARFLGDLSVTHLEAPEYFGWPLEQWNVELVADSGLAALEAAVAELHVALDEWAVLQQKGTPLARKRSDENVQQKAVAVRNCFDSAEPQPTPPHGKTQAELPILTEAVAKDEGGVAAVVGTTTGLGRAYTPSELKQMGGKKSAVNFAPPAPLPQAASDKAAEKKASVRSAVAPVARPVKKVKPGKIVRRSVVPPLKPSVSEEPVDEPSTPEIAASVTQTAEETFENIVVTEAIEPSTVEEIEVFLENIVVALEEDVALENLEAFAVFPTEAETVAPVGCDERLCDLIGAGDYAGAFWNALSVEQSGDEVEVEVEIGSVFLRAFAGALLIGGEGEALAQDLSELFRSDVTPRNDAERLLQMGASLRPVLLAPATSEAWSWLQLALTPPATLMALRPLFEAVREFATYGVALRALDLDSASAAQNRKDEFERLSNEASSWLKRASAGHIAHRRSSMVRSLLGDHEFKDWLRPVIEGDRSALEETRAQAAQMRDRDWSLRLIHQIDFEKVKKKAAGTPIEGAARDQLFRLFEEAANWMEKWCVACDEEARIAQLGENWALAQVEELRQNLKTHLPDALALLRELRQGTETEPLALAACLMIGALQLLTFDLKLEIDLECDCSLTEWNWLRDESGLNGQLGRRLLLNPALALDDELQPDLSQAATRALLSALPPAFSVPAEAEAALEGWCRARDFRWVETALLRQWNECGLLSAEALARWTSEIVARRDEARDELRALLAEANDAIEQAVVDGVLEDGAAFAATIAAIAPEKTLDFRTTRAEIERVMRDIDEERARKSQEQRAEWEQIALELESSSLDARDRTRVREIVERLLQKEPYDPRVVDEHLSWTRELLEGGNNRSVQDLAPDQSSRLAARIGDFARAFWDDYPHLFDALETLLDVDKLARKVDEALTVGAPARAQGAFNFGDVPADRRREAALTVNAWATLKKLRGQRRRSESASPLRDIFAQFFEFSFRDATTAVKIDAHNSSNDALFAEIRMEPLSASPIPQFGSLENGSFLVACFWDQPTPDRLALLIEKAGVKRRNVIALYLSRLPEKMREDLVAECRNSNNNLSLVVLDETLLFSLCLSQERRLPQFLECALPLAYANPYATSQSGSVRPEMFFGRANMVDDLQNPMGSCLVYGGRQLGKSALLRHAKRGFESKSAEYHAWVVDISLLGQRRDTAESLWFRIRDALIEKKLIKQSETSDDPNRIALRIREYLAKDATRRLLFLFDEADNFLDADAGVEQGVRFPVVTQLRALMVDTEHRFKVVFAGLHSVSRFKDIPNQPLAHYKAPICVGPLEARAAQELIMRPLAALGFEFQSDQRSGLSTQTPSGVLRILSYTNSHPGLIQIFCEKLLDQLMKRVTNGKLPYHITQRDIEDIYRLADMRERIRERFDWTLALDPRYKAIAWSLIIEQLSARQNFARAFSSQEIAAIAASYWDKAFGDIKEEELAGLLEEMKGMGVLSKDREGYFRLRSPNLVRLMGSHDTIFNSLAALGESNPDAGAERDSHHAPLDEAKARFSPLTYAQESTLLPPRFGVSLIVASRASGLGLLGDAADKMLASDSADSRSRVEAIPPAELELAAYDPRLLTAFLDEINNRNKTVNNPNSPNRSMITRSVVWGRMPTVSARQIAALMKASLNFCGTHQKSLHRWMRVLWIFEPQTQWQWLQLPDEQSRALEERIGSIAIAQPRAWNEAGIRARFDALSIVNSDDLCQRVKQTTGGWSFWLDVYFDRLANSHEDARAVIDALDTEIETRSHPKLSEFDEALGWKCAPAAQALFGKLRALTGQTNEPIPLDLLQDESFDAPQLQIQLSLLESLRILSRRDQEITLDPLVWRLAGDNIS